MVQNIPIRKLYNADAEAMAAHASMLARTATLDAKVVQSIQGIWRKGSTTVQDIERLGPWQLGIQHGERVQVCTISFQLQSAKGTLHAETRQFAVACCGGNARLVVADGSLAVFVIAELAVT
jgi:hypothetical protein